jgi:hypothetical protein
MALSQATATLTWALSLIGISLLHRGQQKHRPQSLPALHAKEILVILPNPFGTVGKLTERKFAMPLKIREAVKIWNQASLNESQQRGLTPHEKALTQR